MPQASIEIPLWQISSLPSKQMSTYAAEPGQLSVNPSPNSIRCSSSGILQVLGRFFGHPANSRPPPEEENPRIAGLPPNVVAKIITYLADPFDRATLAMTCRLMQRSLAPYRGEFALFRRLIADKRRIDYCKIPYWKRDLVFIYELFTQCDWASPRARKALDKAFARLDALYPRVPERVFHEMWPLVGMMEETEATELLKKVVERAKQRSPHWAVMVLREFATRTIHFGDRRITEAHDFNDMLLELAIPLWKDPTTAQATDAVIGAIAQHVDLYRSDRRIEARWARILSLLPPSADVRSKAVLGLSCSGSWMQDRWIKQGRRPGIYFPAEDMLLARLGNLPTAADRMAYRHERSCPDDRILEHEIEVRRHARYVASPRYAKDQARDAEYLRAMAWGRSDVPCATAGGC